MNKVHLDFGGANEKHHEMFAKLADVFLKLSNF